MYQWISQEKTVILVTHHLEFLNQADKIVIIEDGELIAIGKYDELIRTHLDFISKLKENEEKKKDKISITTFPLSDDKRMVNLIKDMSNDDSTSMSKQKAVKESKDESIAARVYVDYFR